MEGSSFLWKPFLKKETVRAASVQLFKHAPAAENWGDYVKVGMKVEVQHNEPDRVLFCASQVPSQATYWVVKIIETQGYFALVRYEGMEEDPSRDFWIHIGTDEVHPIGSDTHAGILIPPKYVMGKVGDWRNYVVRNLCGATTLPPGFLQFLKSSANQFQHRVGEKLEVIDKSNLSQLRIARVSRIIGRRMYLRYLDGHKDGFVCHELSSLIHSRGWAANIGHKLQLPPKSKVRKTSLETNGRMSNSPVEFDLNSIGIRVGMKLEAVDPLCPSQICVASVGKMLRGGYLMVKIESYEAPEHDGNNNPEQAPDDNDDGWFCYHITSPYIFRCGFCCENDIQLLPPHGFPEESFRWEEYFKRNAEFVAAPIPDQPHIDHGFETGMKLEMADLMTPTKIHAATVVQVAGSLLRISFDGWESDYDQWLDAQSPDIYPVGWCNLVGHLLEPSEDAPKVVDTGKSSRKRKKQSSTKSPKDNKCAKNSNNGSAAEEDAALIVVIDEGQSK